MLVLSIRSGGAIKIGDDIEVKVLSTKGQQARIGIKAPRKVQIARDNLIKGPKEGNKY